MGFVPNINICYALRYSVMGEKYRIAPNMGKQEILQGEKQNIKCQGLILSIVLWTSIRHQLTEFWMSEVGSDQISCKMFKYIFVFFGLLINALPSLSEPSPIILATLVSNWLLFNRLDRCESGLWRSLVEIWKLTFGRDLEANVWSRFWSRFYPTCDMTVL